MGSGGGNRCGHDPMNPRWFSPPSQHSQRPAVLRRIIGCIRDYYTAPSATLPTLNAVNESDRRQRSERREACLSLLGCLLHYTDLTTFQVGIPRPDGTFQGLKIEFLAERSGLGLRRAERAIRDLAAAGLVSIYPITKHTNDRTYRGFPALRSISKSLFAVFGLEKWLRHEREKAAKRRERKANPRGLANVTMALNGRRNSERQAEPRTSAAPRTTGPRAAREILAAIKASLKGAGPPS